jgi:molybdopterin converting factor small subunit
LIRATVQYFTLVKSAVGKAEEVYEFESGARIEDVWAKVLEKHGQKMEKAGYIDTVTKEPKSILIAMNRTGVVGLRHIGLYEGLKTQLKNGDIISIYPPVMGG